MSRSYRERARKATAELQAGHYAPAISRPLEATSSPSAAAPLQREFHALGVDFDLWHGESDADARIPRMIQELEAKHLLEDDQGARIVRVARDGETQKKKLADGSVVEGALSRSAAGGEFRGLRHVRHHRPRHHRHPQRALRAGPRALRGGPAPGGALPAGVPRRRARRLHRATASWSTSASAP